jgi:hypothetical protein
MLEYNDRSNYFIRIKIEKGKLKRKGVNFVQQYQEEAIRLS